MPNWVWVIYYLFLLLTLISAIYSCFRGKLIYWAYACIIVSLLVPIVGLLFRAQHTTDMNGLGYLFSQLGNGDLWAVLITLCLVYVGLWWVLFIRDEMDMDAVIRRMRTLSETVKKRFYELNNKRER
ncbi:hypothetical protein KFZ58_06365 [Virgibacillus sp. NKC19-16]|nr:hypothetical protein KFZ58_06365 [Virgibacillus sp. NKC19-16]